MVVKVVRPHLVEDEGALHGLAGEARALNALGHPMLPRLFATDLKGERPHLALELVEGPRLSTLVRRFEVNLEQLLPLALNLSAGLHYMGREGWVHLDVKPRNVIMGAQPKLIDLSVARRVDELRGLSAPIGTDGYMAPEQCEPDRFPQLGPATDVWGLGATLHHALAGQLPFYDDGQRFPQLRQGPRPLPASIPEAIAELVASCLRWDPAHRPTPGELADTLEPIVARLPAPRIGRFRPGARTLMQSLEAR